MRESVIVEALRTPIARGKMGKGDLSGYHAAHLLGAVRTQFGKFGDLLTKVDKKLQEASNTIGDVTRKTRYIEGRLRRVEALPDGEAQSLLPELTESDEPNQEPEEGELF